MAAAMKANLDLPSSSKAGTEQRVTISTSLFAVNTCTETSADNETAGNDVNKDKESDYFCMVINASIFYNRLLPLIKKSSVTNKGNTIVPDSGETSHMSNNISVLEDDYAACNNVSVLMDNETGLPDLGY